MKVYILENGQYSVGVKYKGIVSEFDKSQEEVNMLRMGCDISASGEIVETDLYFENVATSAKEELNQKIKNNLDNEYQQYEIFQIMLDMIRALYDASTDAAKAAIPNSTKQRYAELKNKLDGIVG